MQGQGTHAIYIFGKTSLNPPELSSLLQCLFQKFKKYQFSALNFQFFAFDVLYVLSPK